MPLRVDREKEQQSLLNTLNDIPLFQKCESHHLATLTRHMRETTFGPREFLMKQGEEGKRFYIIVEGLCDVVIDGKAVGKLQSGDYCGELALIQNITRTASIQVIKSVRAHWIDKGTFKRVLQDDMELIFYQRNRVVCETFSNRKSQSRSAASAAAAARKVHPREAETRWLLTAVQTNVLFRHLTSSERRYVVGQMHRRDVKRGEAVVREGEEGREFFVVRSGRFKIEQQGKGLLRYVTTRDCFGELALIYNAPRSASVTAMTNGILWAIERGTLRYHVKELAQSKSAQVVRFLKRVGVLGSLLSHEFAAIADALEEEPFEEGQSIVSQGEFHNANKFYLLKSGKVSVYDSEESLAENRPVVKLEEGAYFGERALLKKEPRSATVIAGEGGCECYSLTKSKFELLLGPLSELMNRHMHSYDVAEDLGQLQLQAEAKVSAKLGDLVDLGRIGVGGYGVVKMVQDPSGGGVFALKCVRKDLIVYNKQTAQIQSELQVMQRLSSPFVINLLRTYQDPLRVYFLIDIAMGGDLFHYMRTASQFDEAAVRFYAGCVVEGLLHIHRRGVAYRDLKPENLVICADGYVKIADFGLAKCLHGEKTFTMCGTPDYLSPEAILGRGHDTSVDWWALGILVYEMTAKVPPFMGKPDRIADKILAARPKFTYLFSNACQDLISRLLTKNPSERLGVITHSEDILRSHAFFDGFSWEDLRSKKMPAPYIPKIDGLKDTSNFKMSLQPDPSEPVIVKDAQWCQNF